MAKLSLLLLSISWIGCSLTSAISVTSQQSWNIAVDPQGSVRLNGLSFQQDALTTFGDYQYIAFYNTSPRGYGNHYVNGKNFDEEG
jgi:hypothetical protein